MMQRREYRRSDIAWQREEEEYAEWHNMPHAQQNLPKIQQ